MTSLVIAVALMGGVEQKAAPVQKATPAQKTVVQKTVVQKDGPVQKSLTKERQHRRWRLFSRVRVGRRQACAGAGCR